MWSLLTDSSAQLDGASLAAAAVAWLIVVAWEAVVVHSVREAGIRLEVVALAANISAAAPLPSSVAAAAVLDITASVASGGAGHAAAAAAQLAAAVVVVVMPRSATRGGGGGGGGYAS